MNHGDIMEVYHHQVLYNQGAVIRPGDAARGGAPPHAQL